MPVTTGQAPRAQDRKVGDSTKVSDVVTLEHKVEMNLRDAKPNRIQARYSTQPEPSPWWKFWA